MRERIERLKVGKEIDSGHRSLTYDLNLFLSEIRRRERKDKRRDERERRGEVSDDGRLVG